MRADSASKKDEAEVQVQALAAGYSQLEAALAAKEAELISLRSRLAEGAATGAGGAALPGVEELTAGHGEELQALSGKMVLLQAHADGLARDKTQMTAQLAEAAAQLAEADEARSRFANEAAASAEAADGMDP